MSAFGTPYKVSSATGGRCLTQKLSIIDESIRQATSNVLPTFKWQKSSLFLKSGFICINSSVLKAVYEASEIKNKKF